MAHLLRRAGFGASKDALDEYEAASLKGLSIAWWTTRPSKTTWRSGSSSSISI